MAFNLQHGVQNVTSNYLGAFIGGGTRTQFRCDGTGGWRGRRWWWSRRCERRIRHQGNQAAREAVRAATALLNHPAAKAVRLAILLLNRPAVRAKTALIPQGRELGLVPRRGACADAEPTARLDVLSWLAAEFRCRGFFCRGPRAWRNQPRGSTFLLRACRQFWARVSERPESSGWLAGPQLVDDDEPITLCPPSAGLFLRTLPAPPGLRAGARSTGRRSAPITAAVLRSGSKKKKRQLVILQRDLGPTEC